MPKFTIGIPSYNRPDFLGPSIEAALNQTLPDVEVLVSDDASSDETVKLARSFGDRIRYHRNPTNIGMWPNFAQMTEMARGEYFSWLQDDDLIHRDFARRALEAFGRDESIVFYSGFAAYSPSPSSMLFATLFGPPLPVDWMGGELRVVDGIAVAPMLHFLNITTPPLIAFRTDVIRRAVRHIRRNCDIFNENIVIASALTEGKLAIDPWICAIHSLHDAKQGQILQSDKGLHHMQWRVLAGFFEEFLARLPGHWKSSFRETLEEMPVCHRISILRWATTCAGDWETTPEASRELKYMFINSINEGQRREIGWWITDPPRHTPVTRIKREIKRLLPRKVVRVMDVLRS